VVLVCAFLGAMALARLLLSLIFTAIQIYLVPGVKLERFGAGQGGWALVTGCTDGIGKALAIQLAQRGFNIVLVSRNADKLDSVAKAIEEACSGSVQTRIVVVDFATANDADYDRILAATGDIQVSMLVNNVGVSYDIPCEFHDVDLSCHRAILDVNIRSMVEMTHRFVPAMVERRNGLVLNIGSASGLIPTPFMATYSASKSFVGTFSTAIGAELVPYGVLVENVPAFFVATALSKLRRATWSTPAPDTLARSILSQIGIQGGVDQPYHSLTYPSHAWLAWFVGRFGSLRMQLKVNEDLHRDIRRRALKKRASKSE